MEIIAFLLILGLILIAFKFLGFIFRTGFFLISIPFQILAAAICAVVIFAILPVALITGVFAVILIPLGLFAPLLPILLIGFGLYLLARR